MSAPYQSPRGVNPRSTPPNWIVTRAIDLAFWWGIVALPVTISIARWLGAAR